MKLIVKALALGTALFMVGCSTAKPYHWANDEYIKRGKPVDQYTYDNDRLDCNMMSQRPGKPQVRNDGSIRRYTTYTSESASNECMSVRGWYKVYQEG